MKRLIITTIAFFLGTLGMPFADAREYMELENSYEVAAADIRIPRSGLGVVRVETCEACDKLRFKLTADTRAFVNDQPVSIQQFRNLAMANPSPTYVFYKPGSYEITRLILDFPAFN